MSETEKPTPEAKKTAASKATPASAKKASTTRKTSTTARKKASVSSAATKRVAPKTATSKTTATKKASPAPKKPSNQSSSGEQTATDAPKVEAETLNPDFGEATSQSSAKTQPSNERDWSGLFRRALFMILFGFVSYVILNVVFLIAVVQFIVSAVAGKPNEQLTSAISKAGSYLNEILEFLCFKTEELPFPFGRDFPEE